MLLGFIESVLHRKHYFLCSRSGESPFLWISTQFSILAWNIVEAIYVIRVATLPPAPSASSPSQPQASHFGKSLNTNLKRYTSVSHTYPYEFSVV